MGSMDRERIISLSLKIAEVRAEVGRLSQLSKDLRALESQLDELLGIQAEPENDTLNERVFDVLEASPDREFSAEEIASPLNARIPSVRAALSRLVGSSRVNKNGRGKYQSVRAASKAEGGIALAS